MNTKIKIKIAISNLLFKIMNLMKYIINRRKFLGLFGCGCCSLLISLITFSWFWVNLKLKFCNIFLDNKLLNNLFFFMLSLNFFLCFERTIKFDKISSNANLLMYLLFTRSSLSKLCIFKRDSCQELNPNFFKTSSSCHSSTLGRLLITFSIIFL